MLASEKPHLVFFGGPNGTGKSTVAGFLIDNQSIPCFMNADVVAQGLRKPEGESNIEA